MILVWSSEVDTKLSKFDTKKQTRKTARRPVKNGTFGENDTHRRAYIVQSTEKVLDAWIFVADAIAELRLDNQPPPLVISKIESVNGQRSATLSLNSG